MRRLCLNSDYFRIMGMINPIVGGFICLFAEILVLKESTLEARYEAAKKLLSLPWVRFRYCKYLEGWALPGLGDTWLMAPQLEVTPNFSTGVRNFNEPPSCRRCAKKKPDFL